jgi:ferredoxin--NADP+ reductase
MRSSLNFLVLKFRTVPLTSRLQNIKIGDDIFVSAKPTGTLVVDHLLPGKNLYLISTGTGLAPFMSIIQDPSVYEKYEKVILTHGVRDVSELAYEDFILSELPRNEFFGNEVRNQLIYYPTVTREDFKTTGRLTDHMSSGELFDRIGLPQPNPSDDRFMICGGPSMLKDTCEILDRWNFEESRQGIKAGYVIERAFVE